MLVQKIKQSSHGATATISMAICVVVALLLASCNSEKIYTEEIESDSDATLTQVVSIYASSAPTTKVTIDESDMATVQWELDDRISLWGIAEGADEFSISAASFKLYYYGSTYDKAVFTSNISAMEEGVYNYYATYPAPDSEQNGVVSFNIPSTQSGYYDGLADIMYAKVESAGALGDNANANCSFAFSHLTHALRIEVPADRDYLGGTTRLQITFPQNVVGDISFDVTDLDATMTLNSAGNVLLIDFDQELSQAGYVWAFINPTTITGDVEFVGYNAVNTPSAAITTSFNGREMAAGHVTPITLTIPSETPKSFVISITENNLGEDIESVTLTAPSGAYFYGGSSEITIPVADDGTFSFSYLSSLYEEAFKAGEITMVFESENALVTSDPIVVTDEHNSATNYIYRSIPYLFEEDFSGVSETGSYDLLTGQDLPGLSSYWTDGIIFSYWSATSIAIRSYKLMWVSNGYINLELSGLTALKSDASVSLSISFYADWVKNKCGSMSLVVSNDSSKSSTISMSTNSNASYSSITTMRNVVLGSCNSKSVITWKTSGGSASGTGYDYIYMDNIKIQISK